MVFFDANDVIIEHNDAFGAMVGEDVNLIGLRIEDFNIHQEAIGYHYSDSNSTETYDSVRVCGFKILVIEFLKMMGLLELFSLLLM
ncbi:MAG: hypothetical protein MJ209_05950 [archaeon]|nr:hypothetical protein [archaeon]